MAVPTSLVDVSQTAASNSPAGSESVSTGDDYLRQMQAMLKGAVAKGTDITSASTLALPAFGAFFVVTGTTTVAAISSTNSWDGRRVTLQFSGVLTITHSATLDTGGRDIKTVADVTRLDFVQTSTGNWKLLNVSYVLNVREYGATGDGTTDDRTSIQNAIDAVYNSGNTKGIVHFAAGNYKITSGLTMRNGVALVGVGPTATIISPAGNFDAVTFTSCSDQVGIERLRIDGVNATTDARGIVVDDCARLDFYHVEVTGFATSNPAIVIEGTCYGLRFDQCLIRNSNRLFLALPTGSSGGDLSTMVEFNCCEFRDAASSASAAAIQLQDVAQFTFRKCIFQNNGTITTIYVQRATSAITVPTMSVRIEDCWFEDNGNQVGSRNIYLISTIGAETPATGCVVENCGFHNSGANLPQYMIEMANTDGTRIVGNHCRNTTDKFVLDSGGNTNFRVNNPSVSQTSDLERADRRQVSFASDANKTLTFQEAQTEIIEAVSGVSLGATRNLVLPLLQRKWIIYNATTGGQSIQVIGPSGTGVTIASNKHAIVYSNGTNFVRITADT